MALTGVAMVPDGAGVVVAGPAVGVPVGVGELVVGVVPVGVGACAEDEDESAEEDEADAGVPEPVGEFNASWHPVNARIPPITAITDAPLTPGMGVLSPTVLGC
ncbi:hypothetical protein [Streptomyces antibioticus]|uniref:Uncharacterized protein n=1 Tax=Streptomyces antibioticus TaxID=1890 RepID=A0AAE7CQD5_STRAT|nr:hypothetical protein [Streptomyces antibioticus]MCX4740893.1 hypothetical protein [Streptomyces antibioticus]MCX5173703.1 hypothetical protein [Streptomyces antibioticus]OOQ48228.1 hypothetical protein AFM16_37355 [Streptomyces antibioticus]QIT48593.1 hypothetical protein HCX60_37985 [Streptomyces antibioticus]